MLTVTAYTSDTPLHDVVAWGVPTATGPEVAVASDLVEIPSELSWTDRHRFTGKVGQSIALRSGSGPDFVYVGVGERTKLVGDAGIETVRRAVAAFVKAAGAGPSAALLLPEVEGCSGEAVAVAAAEAAALTSYRFDEFRTEEPPSVLASLVLVGEDADQVASGAAIGLRVAESVGLARDLVNRPAGALTPDGFAQLFSERFADVATIDVEVWDEHRALEERLGGLLGVAAGSAVPPRMIRATYQPVDPIEVDGKVPHVALVGKGITFDSGGLSLKPAGGMEWMKTDMGGAAAVFAALDAAAALGARLKITAIAMLTENLPSGTATKPGDVLRTRNGKTIEVLNTDAEGRLVLSDGLQLATEAEPDAIIDLATLTGACIVALGGEIAGLLGNNEALIDDLRQAGTRSGEAVWPLPLPADYQGHIESEIADMKNIGKTGQAGTISAALLLQEFVGEIPWAHLDIAGPSRAERDLRYWTQGGTGFGAKLLVSLVTSDEFVRGLVDLKD